jgi:hypothetical protein
MRARSAIIQKTERQRLENNQKKQSKHKARERKKERNSKEQRNLTIICL